MDFLTIVFTSIIAMSFGAIIAYTKPCEDIIDIYYTKEQESIAYDDACRYTKTEISCNNCSNAYIGRRFYNEWANEYIKIGLEPPYPKRHDTDRILPPLRRKTTK